MKTLFTIAIFLLPALYANAQHYTIDTAKKSVEVYGNFNGADVHLPVVKKLPEYKGGKKAWQDFLRSNIDVRIPFSNKAAPGIYNVIVRFNVGVDGKLHSVGAHSNCGYGMEAELIRCVKKSENWEAAETEGKIKVAFSLKTIVVFDVKPNNVTISFK